MKKRNYLISLAEARELALEPGMTVVFNKWRGVIFAVTPQPDGRHVLVTAKGCKRTAGGRRPEK